MGVLGCTSWFRGGAPPPLAGLAGAVVITLAPLPLSIGMVFTNHKIMMIEGVGLLPYSERLQILDLTTLAERRSRGDLIEVYKASQGLSQLAGVLNFSRSGLNKIWGGVKALTMTMTP